MSGAMDRTLFDRLQAIERGTVPDASAPPATDEVQEEDPWLRHDREWREAQVRRAREVQPYHPYAAAWTSRLPVWVMR